MSNVPNIHLPSSTDEDKLSLFSPRVIEGRIFVNVHSLRHVDLSLETIGYYCILTVEKQSSCTATVAPTKDKHHKHFGIVEWNQKINFDFTQESSIFKISVCTKSYKKIPSIEIGDFCLPVSYIPTGQNISKEIELKGQALLYITFEVTPLKKRKITEDQFERLKIIGKGSFGTVYQVKKKETGGIYAMKVLNKKNIIERNAVKHAIAERTVLKKINHPFLVHMKYAFQNPEYLFMVIDYLNGGELFFHLQEDDSFNEERAKFYAAEIVLAIGYLHDNSILYRDLKPENILLDMTGHICIVDFGLSKTDMMVGSRTKTFCGSLEYMAPEVISGNEYSHDIDWWALATMVYEMIEGIPPFWNENSDLMLKQICECDLSEKFDANKFSPECIDFIVSILKVRPEERLGYGPGGTEDIKGHSWFYGVNWVKIYNKEVDPPFKPHIKDELDLRYFDSQITSEDPNTDFLKRKKQMLLDVDDPFDDFSFEEDTIRAPSKRASEKRQRLKKGNPLKLSITANTKGEKKTKEKKTPRNEEDNFSTPTQHTLTLPTKTNSAPTKSIRDTYGIANRKLSHGVAPVTRTRPSFVVRARSKSGSSAIPEEPTQPNENQPSIKHTKSFNQKLASENDKQNCTVS